MKPLYLLLVVLFSTFYSYAQTGEKEKQIKTLLEVSGSGKIGVQVMSNIIETYKKTYPFIDASFWDEFKKEVSADEIVELLVPIYAKHFTLEDIQQLIDFYNTPIGKKLVDKMPLISQDSYVVGAEWGKKLSEKVYARLKAKGYEL